MNKVLERFIWQKEDEPQNMLSYLFLLVNIAYGVGFAFFGSTAPIMNSVINAAFFPGWAWGIACLLIVLTTLIAIGTRKRSVGTKIAYPAIAVWGYGFVLSLLELQFLAAFAVFFPQMLFWLFWHVGVIRHYDKQDRFEGTAENRQFIEDSKS